MNYNLENIELYYSPIAEEKHEYLILDEEEFHHCIHVMRNNIGDDIYITNGKGIIFLAKIETIEKKKVITKKITLNKYENKFSNLILCIPKLKTKDRLDFALEKSVELGITKFILFESKRTIPKGGSLNRLNKRLTAAMKQSLRAHVPEFIGDIKIGKINDFEGDKFVFDINGISSISEEIKSGNISSTKDCIFIFGPEGGLTKDEIELIQNKRLLKQSEKRLRSETSIIAAASVLTNQ